MATLLETDIAHLSENIAQQYAIPAQYFEDQSIKRGLRNADGTGVLIGDYLRRNVEIVTAVDISPEMVRIARKKFPQENVTVLCGDAAQTHFPAPFDCIVIYNAFPHFPEPEQLISHLAGLLTPGGTLTVAHGFSRKALDAHHAKTARSVSNGLLPVEALAGLFAKHLTVTVQISNDEMYQVVGQCC